MSKLKNELRKIELLCWSTKREDQIKEKVDQYLKAYPHIRNPASIDLLERAIKQWFRIQKAEEMLEKTDDFKERTSLMIRIEQMTKIWMTMITNLGLSFTKQQYISKKSSKVVPPLEKLKELTEAGKKIE